jgi:hypothetical protein
MNKFEQLLDFIVNEEKDKAEELFHSIVVEKSRDIYEQLIAEETKEEDPVEEETDDETVAEEESVEEAFGMDGEEEPAFPGGDSADGLPGDTEAPTAHDEFGGDEEGGDETAPATKGDVQDLEDALEDLKAEFERLMSGDEGSDEGSDEGDEEPEDGEEAPEFGDEEEDEPEDESAMPFEGRQLTREYRETIGKPYGSGNGISNKNEAGDGKAGPVNQNPKDRPSSGATAKNIAQGSNGTEGIKGGEGLVGGVKGEFTKGVQKNISSSSMSSMKSGSETTKNPAGHGAEKKGSGESAGNTKSIVDRKIG